MKKTLFATVALGFAFGGAAFASENITIYYSPSCPYCHYAREDINDILIYEYPNLTVTEVDVSNPDNGPTFVEVLNRCGLKSGGVPVVVYGDKCEQGYSGLLLKEMRELLDAKLNEEEKTLVASNRKAMEEDAAAFKARNADRKKAIVKFDNKKESDVAKPAAETK